MLLFKGVKWSNLHWIGLPEKLCWGVSYLPSNIIVPKTEFTHRCETWGSSSELIQDSGSGQKSHWFSRAYVLLTWWGPIRPEKNQTYVPLCNILHSEAGEEGGIKPISQFLEITCHQHLVVWQVTNYSSHILRSKWIPAIQNAYRLAGLSTFKKTDVTNGFIIFLILFLWILWQHYVSNKLGQNRASCEMSKITCTIAKQFIGKYHDWVLKGHPQTAQSKDGIGFGLATLWCLLEGHVLHVHRLISWPLLA